jgi:hypothetical protein
MTMLVIEDGDGLVGGHLSERDSVSITEQTKTRPLPLSLSSEQTPKGKPKHVVSACLAKTLGARQARQVEIE